MAGIPTIRGYRLGSPPVQCGLCGMAVAQRDLLAHQKECLEVQNCFAMGRLTWLGIEHGRTVGPNAQILDGFDF